MRRTLPTALALLVALAIAGFAQADQSWTGLVSNPGDWSLSGNWTSAVPGTGDNVTISFNSPNVAAATVTRFMRETPVLTLPIRLILAISGWPSAP